MKLVSTLLTLITCAFPLSLMHGQSLSEAASPPLFIENGGQWAREARFLARTAGTDLWLSGQSLLFDHHVVDGSRRRGHIVRLRFAGSRTKGEFVGEAPAATRTAWLVDGGGWRPRSYHRAILRDLYPGVDLRLLLEDGRPRYDFLVSPGIDPKTIRIAVDGAEGLKVLPGGELSITTSVGEVLQGRLRAWQTIGRDRRPIPCSFQVNQDGTVGFRLGKHDRRHPLVIDPLVYSSYLGGAGNDRADGVAADAQGNVWVVGSTFSVNFPTIVGGYNTLFSSPRMVYVTKINSTRGGLPVYSTFIGQGTAGGIAVDAGGNAYVAAVSDNTAYPTTPGAYAATPTGNDVYVSKISADGTSLVYSARIGSGVVTGIALDGTRPILVGYTPGPYPSTPGAFDTTITPGGPDVFVTKVSVNGSSLSYSTFLGGGGFDRARGVAVNGIGEVFVTGSTSSRNFPTTPGAFRPTGDTTAEDGFVARMGRNGDSLIYSTYLGGTGIDLLNGIAINDSNEAYVTGQSMTGNFPTTPNAYRSMPYDSNDAVVVHLARGGDSLVYSTFIGGTGVDIGSGIAVDDKGQASVVGRTFSNNFSRSTNRLQGTYGGNGDGFITRLTADGGSLVHSTYLGGSALDELSGVALGPNDDIIAVGVTTSTNHPITPNATQIVNGSLTDAIVARLAVLQILHPKGGNVLCAGTLDSIVWNGSPSATYDLYISNDRGRTFSQLALAVNGTSYPWLVSANIRPDTTYRLRIVTTGGSESDTTDTDFTINARPKVTANPAPRVEPAGGTAVFTAQATGAPTPTVQWQADSGLGWSNIAGATSRTLQFDNLGTSQNGIRYRAVFRNGCGIDSTTDALLIVTGLTMLSPLGGEIFCSGDTIDISWEATGTTGPFSLQISTNSGSGWDVIDGGVTGTTYRWPIPASLSGTKFRLRIVLPPGFTIGATAEDFQIHTPPTISEEPPDVTVREKDAFDLRSDASGLPIPDVQWEVNDGSGWSAISGGVFRLLRIFDADTSMTGWRFRAIFTTDCGADTSREAIVTVVRDTSVTGVDDDILTGGLRLSTTPNPARDRLDVRYASALRGPIELAITDLLGCPAIPTRLMMHDGGEGIVTIDVSDIPAGVYFCIVRQRGATAVTRVVVR